MTAEPRSVPYVHERSSATQHPRDPSKKQSHIHFLFVVDSGKIACIIPSNTDIHTAASKETLSHRSGRSRILDAAWPTESSPTLMRFHIALAGSPWVKLLRDFVISGPQLGNLLPPISLNICANVGRFLWF